MKILIVDENANNRTVLRFLLQDYGKDNNSVYDIDECVNGIEAVDKAKEGEYSIIFMDTVMPGMDGVEATKRIHENDPEVMIIAVLGVDEELRQNEILRNGAEDYVVKPIDAKLLNARLDNYFALLRLRQHTKLSTNRKAANLYTDEIYKRQTIFYISCEEALAEFWEFYLLSDMEHKLDGLSDVVRAIFSLGEAIVKLKGEPWIIVEEDNDALYFTINRAEVIGKMIVNLIMEKNKEIEAFKCNDGKFSLRLEKTLIVVPEVDVSIEENIVKVEEVKDNIVKVEEVKENIVKVEELKDDIPITKTDVNEYQVFHYMDAEDLEETEELLGDLSSIMLMLGNSDIEPSEVANIAHNLDKLGRNLTTYTESFVIGQSLIDLSVEISAHANRFQEIAADLSTLSSAFIADLQGWLKMTFYDGAPSSDFMNDTIAANTQTISTMLSEDDSVASTEDMDDIFDF